MLCKEKGRATSREADVGILTTDRIFSIIGRQPISSSASLQVSRKAFYP